MIYLYHKLLFQTTGIRTWINLFKSNYLSLTSDNCTLIDSYTNINVNSNDIIIINHLDIMDIVSIYDKFKKIYVVIHNLEEPIPSLLKSNIKYINCIISIFPENVIKNIISIDFPLIYLPNINLLDNTVKQSNYYDHFAYFGRIGYEKNIILLIDLFNIYQKEKKLYIYYPKSTDQTILNFYLDYIKILNITNVFFKNETYHDPNENFIYLSAGAIEGLPYTFLELLPLGKIIIAYNTGIINNLLDDDFLISFNLNLEIKNIGSNLALPLINTGSYCYIEKYIHYIKNWNGLPYIHSLKLLPTYFVNNHIRNEYMKHLQLWNNKISCILNNIEHYKELAKNNYLSWYNNSNKLWKENLNLINDTNN
jgi:hypothetical protein